LNSNRGERIGATRQTRIAAIARTISIVSADSQRSGR
jgi:hypothetical protein